MTASLGMPSPNDGAADGEMRVEALSDLSALRGEWDALAHRSGNLFVTWEWASTWWRLFGAGRRLLLYGWRGSDGRLRGILPLYVETSGRLRAIRFLGSGLSQQLGPVCDARERASAAQALRLALRESPHRWDLFIASDLPAEEGWHDLLGGLRVRATPSPALRLVGSSWREFLACRSANFRRQVGREERRLAQSYDVRFRMADDATRLDADLDMLFALHTARWGRAASAAFAAVERFHRELAALACERGWLRLRFLELDGRPAAALYGFRFADAEWFFQSGRDPSLTRYSPGFVLLARAVREAIASDRARPTSRRIRRGSRTGCRTRRSGPT